MFAVLAILTASFIPFIIIFILIIIHELGHFLMAKILNVEVKKIYLYPLGGISKFFLPLNSSFLKEFLILIAGPISQEIAKILLLFLLPKEKEIILMYHYGILLFNLLPVYPLDGGKLIHLIFSVFLPYRKSFQISIFISYIIIAIYLFLNIRILKINNISIITFLIYKVYSEQNKINYLYEKFILERYLNNYNYKSSKLITNVKNFYRNKRHLLFLNNTYYLEKDYLDKKYKKSE